MRTNLEEHPSQSDVAYLQIANELEVEIKKLPPHTKITSTTILRGRFNISKTTINRVIVELKSRGVVYAKKRSGVYVSPSRRDKTILILHGSGLSKLTPVNVSSGEHFFIGAAQYLFDNQNSYIPLSINEKLFLQQLDELKFHYTGLSGIVFFRCPEIMLAALPVLKKESIPYILYGSNNYKNIPEGTLRLISEEEKIFHLAFNFFKTKGFDKVGVVHDGGTSPIAQMRMRVVKEFVGKAGVTVTEFIYEKEYEDDKSYMEQFHNFIKDHSAVLCISNSMALHLCYLCQYAFHIAIPEKLSVISIDNTDYATISRPPLTVVNIPLYEDGARSVEILISKIEKGSVPLIHKSKVTLVERGSTVGKL